MHIKTWKYYRFKEALQNHCMIALRLFKSYYLWTVPSLYMYIDKEITQEKFNYEL